MAAYGISTHALQRWSRERLTLTSRDGGGVDALFTFDGSTCSNLGMPVRLFYYAGLSCAADGHRILSLRGEPAPGHTGYQSMCSWLENPERMVGTLLSDVPPLLGKPLDAVLFWAPRSLPAGCVCARAARCHKWQVVLQTIHFTLSQQTPNP